MPQPKNVKSELYHEVPSVDRSLNTPWIARLIEQEGRAPVVEAVRTVLSRIRTEIAQGHLADRESVRRAIGHLDDAVTQQLRAAMEFSLKRVINATGVILHTNLGRAPLCETALQRIHEVARVYSNLEFNLGKGERGKRDVHAERLFSRLLNQNGVSDVKTVVVNNCAAAVLLALNTLAEGGEVIVSRGELVEIGGSFRVPEVMTKSGAVLREVGTTNRTRIEDYERAINENTRLLLRVHRSNFAIIGFTEQPSLEALAALGRKHGIPLMEDLGGGALVPMRRFGIDEGGVLESLRAGVDLVTYSGDKLLGGPQAGMLSGRPELIGRIRSNPLFRALRVDKLTYAALEGTLIEYLRQTHQEIPTVQMMALPATSIRDRAMAMIEQLKAIPDLSAQVVDGFSLIGGGTAPSATLPTFLIAVSINGKSADELSRCLRNADPPIVARVEEGKVLLDLRTVFDRDEIFIGNAFTKLSMAKTEIAAAESS